MAADCIFCRIVQGTIPADIVYEDQHTLAFRDLHPQAPVHVLIVPRRHLGSTSDLREEDRDLAGSILLAASKIARDQGVADGGYRLVANSGEEAGQSVGHLHVHLLGGRRMTWPPG